MRRKLYGFCLILRFEETGEELNELLLEEKLVGVPVLIYANKQVRIKTILVQ